MKHLMIDWNNNLNLLYVEHKKVIMTCTVRLSRNEIIDALKADSIYINGFEYKTPIKQLLYCLELEKDGDILISFEQL